MLFQDFFNLNEKRFSKLGISQEWLAGFWSQVVSAIAYVLIVVVCIYPAAVISNGHPGVSAAALITAIIFFPICILVHEVGHAVAAWLVGWRVHLIVVGSRGFAPHSKKFFRISRHRRQRDIGGWVHVTPPPDSAPNKGAITVKIGGAIGNLVLAVLSMLLAATMYEVEIYLYAFLLSLSGVSVVYAVRNLIPTSRPGVWESDGASLVRIIKGEEPAIYDQSLARLFGMVYDNIPVEEWDVSVLKEVVDGPASDRQTVDPLLIGYTFCMADLATARLILERYLGTNPGNSLEYQCMYAFTIAMMDRDAFHASKILEELPSDLVQESFSFWRAQAVTAHLLGRREEAREAIWKARQIDDKTGTPPDVDDEMVFEAIERGRDLPRLEPRQRLSAGDTA